MSPASAPAKRRIPRYLTISAWAIPVMVIGQFSMLAIVPVAIVAIGPLVDARIHALRWWTGLLAVLYATPLIIWIVRPDGAHSLSKDMHPAFIALIVTAAVALLLKIYTGATLTSPIATA